MSDCLIGRGALAGCHGVVCRRLRSGLLAVGVCGRDCWLWEGVGGAGGNLVVLEGLGVLNQIVAVPG